MKLTDRRQAFIEAFPQWSAAWPRIVEEKGQPVLYATWLLGNDYRARSTYYGAYPPNYLSRVWALFPDVDRGITTVLHAYSGSLPPGPYSRCDLSRPVEYVNSVEALPQSLAGHRFQLVLADPPYSLEDAVRYGTPPVNRGKALAALAEVTLPGGHVVWLDTAWPMHRKAQWRTVGRITVVRSTNHRVRMCTIFERAGV